MEDADQIFTLEEFQRDAKTHAQHLKETGGAEILTLDGKPAFLVKHVEPELETKKNLEGLIPISQLGSVQKSLSPEDLLARFRERRERNHLEGLTIKELRDFGRR